MSTNNHDESLKSFLQIVFDPEETVCSSKTVFATDSKHINKVNTDDCFISINPIIGSRSNANVTSFRTFLFEIDPPEWQAMPETEQLKCLIENKKYIENLSVPYTTCTYTGNKSHHYLLVLDEPLTSLDSYKYYAKWLLNILVRADQQTTAPSISTRLPGHYREDTGRHQCLIEIRNRVRQKEFLSYLQKFPEKKPSLTTYTNRRLKRYKNDHDNSKGKLSKRTQLFLAGNCENGFWHKEIIYAVKDLKAQGYSKSEAYDLLLQIEGQLDNNSKYQISYGYNNSNWEMEFRPHFENDE